MLKKALNLGHKRQPLTTLECQMTFQETFRHLVASTPPAPASQNRPYNLRRWRWSRLISSLVIMSLWNFFLPSMWTIEVRTSEISEAVLSIMKPFNFYLSKQNQHNTDFNADTAAVISSFLYSFYLFLSCLEIPLLGSCLYFSCPTHIITPHPSFDPTKYPYPPFSPTPFYIFIKVSFLLSFCLVIWYHWVFVFVMVSLFHFVW